MSNKKYNRKGIVATVLKDKSKYYFYTLESDMAETAMTNLGYGCTDYNLAFFEYFCSPVI